jgi:acetate kinase
VNATLLVVNAGSSSLKFSVYAGEEQGCLAEGEVDRIGLAPRFEACATGASPVAFDLPPAASHAEAFAAVLRWLRESDSIDEVGAVAHRVVHGGSEFHEPVVVTTPILAALEALIPLAPLHQPHNLALLEAASRALPGVPQIACFDTAFHAGHDALMQEFALPREWADRGVRRYGFHGLSYEWISEQLRIDHPRLHAGRVVVAHLGNGASLCALLAGRSVDTTMGMTALDGLPMGTRCGAIDAGAVLFLQAQCGMSVEDVQRLLYRESGLLGLSGESSDMRCLLESESARAGFAIDYYALKVAQYSMMMAVSMGGLDAIVFTAGIGTHADEVRQKVMHHLAPLANVPVLVIPTDEERMMARHAQRLLEGRTP